MNFETNKSVIFNTNDRHTAAQERAQGATKQAARPDLGERIKIATASKAIDRSEDIREAAAAVVRDEVIASRLGGDERMFNRWKSNNSGYWSYRLKLAEAGINGVAANIQTADEHLEARKAAMPWRELGPNSVAAPDGRVMSKKMATFAGWSGK